MKFIHSSDWHIGRQFHNVSFLEDQAHVLQQIVEYIKLHAVDALVIAGDIYDRSIPPAMAVQLLDKLLHQICSDLNVPVILIPGNHDSAERLGFASGQLKQGGLHILGDLNNITEPVIIKKGEQSVYFYGLPYNDPEHVNHHYEQKFKNHNEAHEYLLDKITSAYNSHNCNVLISHCFIDGAQESESERPLSIGGAERVSTKHFNRFDYVALGHLHGPQYRGEKYIRYCGSILKYSFSEQFHNKGVTLVECENNKLTDISHLPLTPLRDIRVIEGEIENIIEQGKTDPHAQDYLLVRLTDKHAILNAMGKLREVYPNVLHLEKPGMLASQKQYQVQREKIKSSEVEMFRDFFHQVQGSDLTEEQDKALQLVIASLDKSLELSQ